MCLGGGEEGPSAFWPESFRRVHGGLLPGAAALRRTAACRLYPRGRPLRPPTAAQTLQEDLQEDGQDPETSVCAVILSTNQLANIPVEDG